jgi:hypothetical protein
MTLPDARDTLQVIKDKLVVLRDVDYFILPSMWEACFLGGDGFKLLTSIDSRLRVTMSRCLFF